MADVVKLCKRCGSPDAPHRQFQQNGYTKTYSACRRCESAAATAHKRTLPKSSCHDCGQPRGSSSTHLCERCRIKRAALRAVPENRLEANAKGKKYRLKLKAQVIAHYGRDCACCKENNLTFLTVDHVDGGGTKHRQQVGTGHRFYRWLVQNGFPGGFQVLCFNCNFGKYLSGGVCPHQSELNPAGPEPSVTAM